MDKPEYNTLRPPIKIREYGRNLHKLVAQCKLIEDRRERTKRAYQIVSFMAVLNSEVKDNPEQRQKYWDHLFVISGFELDVDAPYPPPDPETFSKKPPRMPYSQSRLRFRYYGKNIERMIAVAIKMKDSEDKQAFVNQIASYMKLAYMKYNDAKVSDEVITNHIKQMSDNKLEPTEIKNLVKPGEYNKSRSSSKSGKGKQQKKKSKPSRKK